MPEDKERGWENEEPPAVGEDQVQVHLRNLKMHKSMRPDEMYPCVLKELADEIHHIWEDKAAQWSSHWLVEGKQIFKKGKKGRLGKLQSSQSHLCAQKDLGPDAPGNYAKAHGKWGD